MNVDELPKEFNFRLFIAGDATNSLQALSNLRALCQEYVPERFAIEVIDVFADPTRALGEGVFMTPTLIRLAPMPTRRIVGTLSQTDKVLQVLGLEAAAT